MENTNSAPTGCYKCGRPGHWSRDCPSSASTPASDNLESSSFKVANSRPVTSATSGVSKSVPKKVPRSRPKLTADLLLSDDGLGYVLRYFPGSFRYGGRGREVSDLGSLISLYGEWHSHLLPYYSFDQFVHKAEQVAASKRVKTCIRDLRERVASGGDPTKLHEDPSKHDDPNKGQGAGHSEEQSDVEPRKLDRNQGDPFSDIHGTDNLEESMLHEIYQNVTREPSQDIERNMNADDDLPVRISRTESAEQVQNDGNGYSSEAVITEVQRARMEANRLKALERASASSPTKVQITEEQRARMEVNRLKALERAAASRKRQLD
ncbi:hypothetical protein SLEP1_g24280 [Rubroshorea leprosula]|uniref:CCHC-type domain-containing protein n=1 Tax=Rubroshorea leprosula TaxID=152421 RepID=A0AAV5JF47_9ROSI|nr:hypothetical protein SLEP1_g24280 [Rubroshorea leprosula]